MLITQHNKKPGIENIDHKMIAQDFQLLFCSKTKAMTHIVHSVGHAPHLSV